MTEAANTDGTQNYNAVVTATPTGSLVFTEDSMPQMLKVNVDGTNTKTVPITSADLNSDGTRMVSYSFEDLFIGGSLRRVMLTITARPVCVSDMILHFRQEQLLKAVNGTMEQQKMHWPIFYSRKRQSIL